LVPQRVGSSAGTGKTLSLICGALKWLEETNARDAVPVAESSADTGEMPVPPLLPAILHARAGISNIEGLLSE